MPWPIIGLLVAALGGIIWLNVQIATTAQKVDFLYSLEMARYPRQGPRPEAP